MLVHPHAPSLLIRDYDANDTDHDERLDFTEFCRLISEREDHELTVEELKARFTALDMNKNGYLEMNVYLRWALRDALARSASRVIEVFQVFDEDGSGQIDIRSAIDTDTPLSAIV